MVQPVQAIPEEATITSTMQEEAAGSSVQGIRTIQASTQVPVVVSPGNQQLHTVTLQTVPLTTVIASTDPSSGAGPQKFILQAIPSSQPMTVLKENVLLQSQKPGSPPSIVFSPTPVQQVLTGSVQSLGNGAVSMASPPNFSATAPVVTFSRSSQLAAHPPGTVITSVIKAQETKTPAHPAPPFPRPHAERSLIGHGGRKLSWGFFRSFPLLGGGGAGNQGRKRSGRRFRDS